MVSRPKFSIAALVCAALLVSPGAPPVTASSGQAAKALYGGLPRRGYLGFTLESGPEGFVVQRIGRNSAAALAGLKSGDVVTAVDGAPIGDGSAFAARIRSLRAGDALRLTISGADAPREVEFAVDPPPREGDLDAVVEQSAFPGAGGLLRTVWAFPKKQSGPRPAVVIVRGVGAGASDAPGSNPFRDLAFHLAGQGFVVVRYDSEGIGDSQGGPSTRVDFDTEIADLKAALAHVRADSRVDASRVALVAQGTGGGVAAVVASGDPGVGALVVLGTIARPLIEYALESRRAQLQLAGVPPAETHELLRRNAAVFARISGGEAPTPDRAGIVAADGSVMGKGPAFWRQYDAVNWGRVYAELAAPVMNAVGEYDFVSTLADHRAIADALRAGGRTEGLLVVLEGVDHDLRMFDSREAAFRGFGSADARPSDRAFSRIAQWVRDNLRNPPASAGGPPREPAR